MKVVFIGKEHVEGVSKKTNRPFSCTVLHYLSRLRRGEGEGGKTLWLDASEYPIESITLGIPYNVEKDLDNFISEITPCSGSKG